MGRLLEEAKKIVRFRYPNAILETNGDYTRFSVWSNEGHYEGVAHTIWTGPTAKDAWFNAACSILIGRLGTLEEFADAFVDLHVQETPCPEWEAVSYYQVFMLLAEHDVACVYVNWLSRYVELKGEDAKAVVRSIYCNNIHSFMVRRRGNILDVKGVDSPHVA